jgi:hypothetical protein
MRFKPLLRLVRYMDFGVILLEYCARLIDWKEAIFKTFQVRISGIPPSGS